MKLTNIITRTTIIFCFIFLFNHPIFGQLLAKANAKDWLALDPKTDSIAGISLYKAYELLKDKASKLHIARKDLVNIKSPFDAIWALREIEW